MIALFKRKDNKNKGTLKDVEYKPLPKIKVNGSVFKHKCPKCGGRAKLNRKKNYSHGRMSRPIKSLFLDCVDCNSTTLCKKER